MPQLDAEIERRRRRVDKERRSERERERKTKGDEDTTGLSPPGRGRTKRDDRTKGHDDDGGGRIGESRGRLLGRQQTETRESTSSSRGSGKPRRDE